MTPELAFVLGVVVGVVVGVCLMVFVETRPVPPQPHRRRDDVDDMDRQPNRDANGVRWAISDEVAPRRAAARSRRP